MGRGTGNSRRPERYRDQAASSDDPVHVGDLSKMLMFGSQVRARRARKHVMATFASQTTMPATAIGIRIITT